jgi:hypothetical protein
MNCQAEHITTYLMLKTGKNQEQDL